MSGAGRFERDAIRLRPLANRIDTVALQPRIAVPNLRIRQASPQLGHNGHRRYASSFAERLSSEDARVRHDRRGNVVPLLSGERHRYRLHWGTAFLIAQIPR